MPPRPTQVALTALLACAISLPGLAAVPAGAAAEIVSLQGQGDQRAASTPEWHPARPAQVLSAGDFVRTREAARMALLFADETQLRLHQNTVLQVKTIATAGQPVTTLRLDAGRAWTQTRRPTGSSLQMETPAATAAIRGTDWDIRVEPDGRTLLTVLSGTVDFGNEQGRIAVGANEAAYAEVGKAPIKLVLGQPRDRVQWVNALQADPLPHLAATPLPAALEPVRAALAAHDLDAARTALARARASAPPQWTAAMEAAIALQAGDWRSARDLLARQLQGQAPLPVWLMQSDLLLIDGEGADAIRTLERALQQWPAHPALLAQLARAQLLTDRVPDAEATLATAQGVANPELALARAALARRQGDAPATLAAYADATALAPQDARGWLGLGSVYTERENTGPARKNLQQALALDPHVVGAQGERGTLETFSNRFAEAESAFASALDDQPADYVALTGLGLLRLKQGQPQAALEAFLRAGVMEPRYARARTWTAVAYYQLDRHQDAISTLRQASVLDDKDPVPYMLLAQIYTDLFQPGEAVQAARSAVTRMPYLKSLNQLANDQKGSANLGASLAFFGMEDWALELAQQSFSPYWGASHLFLADRYRGEFNKNSELFQGFLTDPMAFGASPRYSSLLQKPGAHGTVDLLHEQEFYKLSAPSVTFNGMDNRQRPIAWFLKAQKAKGGHFPIDVGVTNQPAAYDPSGTADADADVLTIGLGMQPNEQLNLFAYANHTGIKLRAHNLSATEVDKTAQQGVLGLSYRWSPTEQTWLKLGRGLENMRIASFPTLFELGPLAGVAGVSANPRKTLSDLQLRHSVDLEPGTRWSLALEHVEENQASETLGAGILSTVEGGQTFSDVVYFGGLNAIDRRYTGFTLDGQKQLTPALKIDGAVALQQIHQRVNGASGLRLATSGFENIETAQRKDTERALTPRLGVVMQPAPGATLRLAYQDWLRPLSVSTLTRVETAGIAVEDRLVEAGGRHKRLVAQWSQELGANTFVSARADHLQLRNPDTLGVDLRTPSLPFLEEMRNAQLVNLSSTDLLEDTPSFHHGTLNALAAGVNHMVNRQWSVYGKYQYQHSETDYFSETANLVANTRFIPYIPRHTLALGSTWASSKRLYVSGRAVYRSERFEDASNLTRRPPGWSLDLVGFWESSDKHWLVGVGALNLFGPKSARQKARYVLDARYRF
ncbi:tetratricopeptide repeat protein [Simplicispira suum]|uniref:TonB-dependent receptor n=1 Tax=Simplicispira suum TaxID=2109915 RepID=A0A2S0MZ76_9BURK|nr:tetratricopeptide repeat protein [Simplicispira suum]AVO41202.1 TonB-dependent receptor [Simplicispira suum]